MDQETRGKWEFSKEERMLVAAGGAYSVAAVLPQILALFVVAVAFAAAGEGYETQEWYLYLNYLIPQLGIFLTALLFFRYTKMPVKEFYRPCKWQFFLIAVLLQFGLFSLTFLNILFQEALEGWGFSGAEVTLPSLEGAKILPVLLVVGVLPAIFEETLFRGILTGTMHRQGWGALLTVLISAAAFSLFHANPIQTIYQFLCGAAYALLAVRSGSVLPTMIAHFLNNAVIILVTAFEVELLSLPFVISSAIVLALTLGYLIFFTGRGSNFGRMKGAKFFFLGASVGIILCIITWFVVLCQT